MTIHILILCTHNSARSVLAEGMLNHWASKLGRDVRAHSAGSAPSGRVNPFALEALQNADIKIDDYYSKSWDEFCADGAPPLAAVITVCDSAGKRRAFELTRQAIGYRVLQLLALPLEDLDRDAMRCALDAIGNS